MAGTTISKKIVYIIGILLSVAFFIYIAYNLNASKYITLDNIEYMIYKAEDIEVQPVEGKIRPDEGCFYIANNSENEIFMGEMFYVETDDGQIIGEGRDWVCPRYKLKPENAYEFQALFERYIGTRLEPGEYIYYRPAKIEGVNYVLSTSFVIE